MDGLSAAASIIEVVNAAYAVITLCYSFRAALKNTPRPVTLILEEVAELRDVLEKIEKFSRQPNDADTAVENAGYRLELLCNSDNGPLTVAAAQLDALRTMLVKCQSSGRQGSKLRALKETYRMWLNDDVVKAHLARIERCKSSLTLALTADETTLLLDIREMSASMNATVESVNQNLMHLTTSVLSKEAEASRKSLFQWLSPVSPGDTHERVTSTRVSGTGNWLLESGQFTNWARSECGLLWLTGPPGTGKTSLFATALDHCSQTVTGETIAYFYCDFQNNDTTDMCHVLGALTSQLCRKIFDLPEDLVHAHETSSMGGQKSKPKINILMAAIKHLAKTSKLCLMVDALDECDGPSALAQALGELIACDRNIKLFLTSRQTPELESKLKMGSRIRLEDHSRQQGADIRLYTDFRLHTDERLSRLDVSVQNEVAAALDSKSAGMFQYAQCQLDVISTMRTTKAIRASLSKLPAGLYATYSNILRAVPAEDKPLVRKVLLWLSFSFGSLTIEKLREAIAIESDTEDIDPDNRLSSAEDILSLCSSLIEAFEGQKLRLAHLSVVDYLLSEEITTDATVAMFALTRSEANAELCLDCLTYLNFTEMSKGPCQSADNFARRMTQYPLSKYAAVAWPYHFRESDPPEHVLQHAVNFLSEPKKNAFMSWIQTLNAQHNHSWHLYPRQATPLYYASSFGLVSIVQALIEAGVDLNVQGGRYGGTAIQAAVWRKHANVLRALLDAGADPNVPDYGHQYPLHHAASDDDAELINLLLQYGASWKATDRHGDTASDWARACGAKTYAVCLREFLRATLDGADSVGGAAVEDVEDPESQKTSRSGPSLFMKRQRARARHTELRARSEDMRQGP